MFERMTASAREVVVLAQQQARELQHERIGSEHLLVALLQGETPAARLLRRGGLDADAVRGRLEPGWRERSGHIPFSPHAKAILTQTMLAAQQFDQDFVACAHLLLGVLRVRECRAVGLMREAGADVDAIAIAAVRAARESEPDVPEGAEESFTDLLAEYRMLAAALGRFGRHEDGCPAGDTCTCGLTAALARTVGVLADEPPDAP